MKPEILNSQEIKNYFNYKMMDFNMGFTNCWAEVKKI